MCQGPILLELILVFGAFFFYSGASAVAHREQGRGTSVDRTIPWASVPAWGYIDLLRVLHYDSHFKAQPSILALFTRAISSGF